jgi:hypothetical protein
MTLGRAAELRREVTAAFREAVRDARSDDVLVLAGRRYLATFEGLHELAAGCGGLRLAGGSLGYQAAVLHDWLYGAPPAPSPGRAPRAARVCLRGKVIQAGQAVALDIARQGIAANQSEARRYQAWYVAVEGQRVAPKWLVGKLAGLPVHAFTTGEARRVLAQLGIPVERAA